MQIEGSNEKKNYKKKNKKKQKTTTHSSVVVLPSLQLSSRSLFFSRVAFGKLKKSKSMIRKYHNHTLHTTNPRHREEEPQNNNSHKTPGRQTK